MAVFKIVENNKIKRDFFKFNENTNISCSIP